MHISFKKVTIENFQSLGYAEIDINAQGIVIVRGKNMYEDNAVSNGSGKSSIFEAIMWALYGKTSNGITNVTNRYANAGCYVKLDFSIDSNEYTITRSIKHKKYKTSTVVLCNGSDISSRNKTDTDKLIKNDILKLESDIFLTTVFLSQGYNSRFSLLTPVGRKERIEILSDTASSVDSFKLNVTNLKNEFSDKYVTVTNSISYKQGQIDALMKQITDLTLWLEQQANVDTDNVNSKRVELAKKLQNLQKLSEAISTKVSEYQFELSSKKEQEKKCYANYDKLQSKINELKKMIDAFTADGIKHCPTCNQIIDDTKARSVVMQYQMQYNELLDELRKVQTLYESAKSEAEKADGDYNTAYSKYINLSNNINGVMSELNALPNVTNSSEKKHDLEQATKSKSELTDELITLHDVQSDVDAKLGATNHMLQMITKDFRTYLLNNVIKFLNSRLQEYSHVLYSNASDCIQISMDSSKLDIYIGDALYDSCSGGERRKADIAISLALRDLSLNVAGFSCNLLIIDEIFDTLDSLAIETVMAVITSASDYVDTIYIVSHKDLCVAYDSIITVQKNKNRISDVMIN